MKEVVRSLTQIILSDVYSDRIVIDRSCHVSNGLDVLLDFFKRGIV